MNALDRWREAQGLSYTGLAALLEITQPAASRYCHGDRVPKPILMVRIYLATGGRVTPNDFYDLPRLPARAWRAPAGAAS